MDQEKARERARKRKQCGAVVPLALGQSKCQKFSIILGKKDDDEKMPKPFIAIKLGNECIQNYAFIDSRIDSNTIAYELFQQINNGELKETRVVFQSYTSHTAKALCMCLLIRLCVSELIYGDKFFVTKLKLQYVPIILKISW